MLQWIVHVLHFAVGDSEGILGSADDMVANTRKVLNTTAADEHDGVFLQVVTDTGDVSYNFV